jgi:hypothetical protein
MIAATARTIPKTYASLADVGFGAMRPLLARPGMRPDRFVQKIALTAINDQADNSI